MKRRLMAIALVCAAAVPALAGWPEQPPSPDDPPPVTSTSNAPVPAAPELAVVVVNALTSLLTLL